MLNNAFVQTIALRRVFALRQSEQADEQDNQLLARQKFGEFEAYDYMLNLLDSGTTVSKIEKEFNEMCNTSFQLGQKSGERRIQP
jgi:Zn-dependent M32 family carboxypeptidase